MDITLEPYLLTVDDYHTMGRAGILTEDDRVELIEGQIITMSPIGSRHAACVKRLNQLLTQRVQGRALVGVQDPIHLGTYSEPEPDVALLRPRDDFYAEAHPGPDDVLLLIEVADTTVETDRRIKAPLYARSGIAEFWLVLLEDDFVEVYRRPAERGYKEMHRMERGDALPLPTLEGATLSVDEVLG
ncbi:MAG: Uma2 family endonuclease [Rhodothermales bacterium]